MPDHLALQVSCLRRVCPDKGHIAVEVEDDTLVSLCFDGAVEEDDRNVGNVCLEAYGVSDIC